MPYHPEPRPPQIDVHFQRYQVEAAQSHHLPLASFTMPDEAQSQQSVQVRQRRVSPLHSTLKRGSRWHYLSLVPGYGQSVQCWPHTGVIHQERHVESQICSMSVFQWYILHLSLKSNHQILFQYTQEGCQLCEGA